MLASLAIRDIVLIERLDLTLAPGLSVFTGETGAGKSILLDSLAMAHRARAETGLVRHGAPQGSVIAAFDLPPDHPARLFLAEQGLGGGEEGPLLLRRVLTADGRSRAYLNDQPVSLALLRRVAGQMVEIHGQFESHFLLDPATHLGVLDAFAGLGRARADVTAAWEEWRAARTVQAEAEEIQRQARVEEDHLRATVEDLARLDPRPGEEAELARDRALLMQGEKLVEAMNAAQSALVRNGEVEASLRAARRALERVSEQADGRLDPAIAALDRAEIETAEAIAALERASASLDLDPGRLESVEERLFALRAAARRHDITVEDLPDLHQRLGRRLEQFEEDGSRLARLATATETARTTYLTRAQALSKARTKAARALDKAVAGELPPLKLEKARFRTLVVAQDAPNWGTDGIDDVSFTVATNPGSPPGPLARIASGGELARFMLALKVVLSRGAPTGTIVFDEVDAGIGGAVAAAVGERLARLATGLQVLVVTHSPQVAARGTHHFRVAKHSQATTTITGIESLSAEARREEIARMLAGETITDSARAAAEALLTPG